MRAMSFLLDKVNTLHSGLRDALFGRNEGGPQLPSGFDGPDGNGPVGPDLNSPGLDSLPPGLQNNNGNGADSIPPGIAKQLDLPSPPSPPGSPFQAGGNQFQPGGNQAPNLPFNPPGAPPPGTSPPGMPTPPGGNTPVASNPNPVTAQPVPIAGGTAQPMPVPITGGTAQPMPVPIGAPPPPPGNSGQSYVAQIPQIVQSLFGQGNAAAPAMAAAPANPATANPVPPTAAAAQAAQANPAQAGAPAQGLPGAVGQAAAGTTLNPNAPNPAAAQAARAGEAVPQQAPQGRPDAVPVPQQREGSLLDRLMSLLRPNATTTTPQGTLAPNAAGTTAQAATATTVAALPVAVQATQAPMDARGNTLLAVNDRVAIQRGDTTLTGIYTADGPYRRALRRGSNVLSTRFSSLLMALGLAGPPVTMRGRDAEYELSVAMQWLFWLLAIVAYACLGLAVIAFLPAGSDVFGDSGRAWTGGFAIAGLAAGAGAWWFARHLSGRGASGQASEDEPDEDEN
jgi:hypothetical protein